MTELRCFEDIAPGMAIPALTVAIDRAALVRFAGAADDYVPQHWDHPFMIASGYPDVIVHGWLVTAHLCRAVALWAPPRVATVADYSVRYHQPFYPGLLHCGGEVVDIADGKAHLDLRAQNEAGDIVTKASLALTAAMLQR
jgi:acyl dehydratase